MRRLDLPPIVGITGTAGSGKDTLAAALCDNFGYTRRGFADPVKELLNRRFGWRSEQWNDREWKENTALLSADTVDEYEAKYGRSAPQVPRAVWSPRELAQWLGTEVGRDTFGPDAWVNALFRSWNPQTLLVIPDIRFDNEAQAIRNRGGVILKVIRPGVTPVVAHSSENGVSQRLIDMHCLNDRDITSFLNETLAAFREQLPY